MASPEAHIIQHGPDTPDFPVILSVPHAGRDYPAPLIEASRLSRDRLELLEDRHADAMIADAAKAGFSTLVATRARAWIDLNRHEREVDPDMIDAPMRGHVLIRSAKVTGGLGLIPRRLRGNGEILRHRIALTDLDARIAADHRPYHARLSSLLKAARQRFGVAVLLDVHSMPALTGDGAARIVIGDRFGQSAAGRFTALAREISEEAGHMVAQNIPYAGGHILTAHADPARHIHALQIEIDRSLYLDAATGEPDAGLDSINALILAFARGLSAEALGSSAMLDAAE